MAPPTWAVYAVGAIAATAVFNMVALHCFGGCVARSLLSGRRLECSRYSFRDNIGGRDFESDLAYEPIDVVYTWVNGSDPVWLAATDSSTAGAPPPVAFVPLPSVAGTSSAGGSSKGAP